MADGNHSGAPADPRQALLRVRDLNGRLRGLGFLADPQGTVVTAHETVAGLSRVVLHTPGGQTRVLGADSIELLPAHGVALLRTDTIGGLPGPALPIACEAGGLLVAVPHHRAEDGGTVLVQGGVLGRATAMYPCGDRFELVEGALQLELAGAVTTGAPVLDAETGAVVGVVAPGLQNRRPGTVPAAPLTGEPLAGLLARNAASVPAFGRALNLGGVLQLASVQLGTAVAGPGRIVDLAADRVDRPDGLTGEEPQHPVTVLLGEAGTGRTTELAALTVRRAGGPHPLPTLWLRGADLAPADRSLADAVGRALGRAAGLLAVPAPEPEAVGRLCAAAQRPLLVVLDAPEEALVAPAETWLGESREWLRRSGARLLTACRPDGWESLVTDARVHWLGPLPPDAAVRAARRYGLPPDWLGPADAVHPLALRLAGELHSAGVEGPATRRSELYAGYLDLCCLRIARRLAATAGPRRPGAHRRGGPPPAGEDAGQVRRLAAQVAGRVHEAARLMLGSGYGGLSGPGFERLFPAAGGWARAVLDEGLLVPAGDGYRLAHEAPAEWLQGLHLDLDGALRLLLADGPSAGDRWPTGADGASAQGRRGGGLVTGAGAGHGVPRHRVGPVVAALRRVARTRGASALDVWLHRLRLALDRAEPGSETDWWAGRLLAAVLPASPEPAVHRTLLALLADRAGQDARFGPLFWASLRLAPADRIELLRRLVRADGPERAFRTVTAELLATAPATVIPLLCTWFDDDAVADLAAQLLYEQRRMALDDLTEALAEAAHQRADVLLGRLATDEPSALCRAVDRWSHDPRPERHVAAAVHALRTAPHATGPGPLLLRHTALTLLAREDEPGLHGAALALLIRDPETRAAHLPAALAAYRAEDPFVIGDVLALALPEHPDPVLAAFRERLSTPGAAVAEGLRLLADASDPVVVRRGALLAAQLLRDRPERAGQLADYLDRLLARERDARPLLAEVLAAAPPVRRTFAVALAAPDDPVRARLLDTLLAVERDPVVLTAVLERLAERCLEYPPARLRELLRRIGARWADADAVLVRCAGRTAVFARLLADWPTAEPPPPDGPLLARMRALAGAGRDPQYAAAEAERSGLRVEGLPVPRQGRPHGTL